MHGKLPETTYMSQIEPGSAWTTHELLCDLFFGLPFQVLGLNWVVLLASLAVALGLSWSYQMARQRGAGLFFTLTAFLLCLEACTVHWSARPHVFTYLLFLACYHQCFIATTGLPTRAGVLAFIMFIWGNLHGSFPLGLIMIAARGTGDFIESKLRAESGLGAFWTWKQSLILFVSAGLAACLNLRGAGFISYILGYLSSPKISAHSDEWRSLDFSFAPQAWSFIALFGLLIFTWVYAKCKPKLGEFAYMIFLFFVSIYAMRLLPYFCLCALPAMAVQSGEIVYRLRSAKLPALCEKILNADLKAGLGENSLSGKSLVFIGLALLISLVFLFVPAFRISDFDSTRLPVKAADYLKADKINGLGFVKDNWGSYLYWRLKRPIFMDDATDFYSQSLVDDYTAIFMSSPGWKAAFDKYPFEYVLIPRGLPLEFLLKEDPDWKLVYEDSVSILFEKSSH